MTGWSSAGQRGRGDNVAVRHPCVQTPCAPHASFRPDAPPQRTVRLINAKAASPVCFSQFLSCERVVSSIAFARTICFTPAKTTGKQTSARPGASSLAGSICATDVSYQLRASGPSNPG